ncbi:hypothetical protein GWI33_004735 [Rhynchophorus ferrugineus]|uniref:Uncharacterized protein n=1 Tax=Rhynchophorus ferrugineus TaxID=354439 RepID=A0A834MIL0_RHYFE|nr:hypothetical protein GWI33_004735 [Rhynchophorus ferrugineus]
MKPQTGQVENITLSNPNFESPRFLEKIGIISHLVEPQWIHGYPRYGLLVWDAFHVETVGSHVRVLPDRIILVGHVGSVQGRDEDEILMAINDAVNVLVWVLMH